MWVSEARLGVLVGGWGLVECDFGPVSQIKWNGCDLSMHRTFV